jgi:hypothetical protein
MHDVKSPEQGHGLACAQFLHANVRLPGRLESGLWWTFVPPAMHRIHHTPTREDTNSNYGTILTVWDWLLGTLRRRPPGPKPSFGVETLRDPRSLGAMRLLVLPFTLPRSSAREMQLRHDAVIKKGPLSTVANCTRQHAGASPASGLGRPEINTDGAKRTRA